MDLQAVISQMDAELNRLEQARSILASGTVPTGSKQRKKRKLGAAGRARIVAAMKARWAKAKKAETTAK